MNLNSYPLAKFRFFNWMIGEYGATEQIFQQAPIEEQCRGIARFLGYPTIFPFHWTLDRIEDKIYDYLYLYESALRRFPYGATDFNKDLNLMDYTMRQVKHPEMWVKANLMPSLRDCIIERHYHMDTRSGKPAPTLNSCVIDLDNIIEPEIDEAKLWEESIEFYHLHKHEKAPF